MIISSNPSMASLHWVAYVLKTGCEGGDPSEPLRRLFFEISEARRRIPEVALELFDRRTKVLTLSYSSNVEAVLRNAYQKKLLDRVIALESRPGGEGVVFASRLRDLGVSVKVVPDSTMHIYLKDVDFVMVGADAITYDGCLVHKVGTRLLAEKAYDLSKPIVVVFEPFKINIEKKCGEIEITKREFSIENWGLEIYPLFDETPPELVYMGVTSEGLGRWRAEWLRSVAEKFKARIFG
jgi:translation initiation factor 2B subunit (eIF-2B alpha/beta/delta family)